MSVTTLRRVIHSFAIVFALASATGAQAGHRDTFGSKPGNSRHINQASHYSSKRYSVTNRQHRAPNIARHTTRQRRDTNVNIIVGNRYPRSSIVPTYDYNYYNRRNRRNDNSFNAGLGIGIVTGSVLSVINTPLHSHNYEREHTRVVSRVETGRHGGRNFSLLKDRYGNCFERETNRNGRTIKRRVADYKCDF